MYFFTVLLIILLYCRVTVSCSDILIFVFCYKFKSNCPLEWTVDFSQNEISRSQDYSLYPSPVTDSRRTGTVVFTDENDFTRCQSDIFFRFLPFFFSVFIDKHRQTYRRLRCCDRTLVSSVPAVIEETTTTTIHFTTTKTAVSRFWSGESVSVFLGFFFCNRGQCKSYTHAPRENVDSKLHFIWNKHRTRNIAHFGIHNKYIVSIVIMRFRKRLNGTKRRKNTKRANIRFNNRWQYRKYIASAKWQSKHLSTN